MESWLARQAEDMVQSWEKSIETYYPQYLKTWTDPYRHLEALKKEWNCLDAVKYLHWDKYLGGETNTILDMGAGTGWLSSYLSRYEKVETVFALDCSKYNLEIMLPKMVALTGGNIDKIKPILGLFTPLVTKGFFYDLVVSSSAIHHCPDLQNCLREVYRALKPGGYFIILNETPCSSSDYLLMVLKYSAKILKSLIEKKWKSVSPSFSESGILYDPFLGDRTYCYWQWEAAIKTAGFMFTSVTTPYYPYRTKQKGSKLTHFLAHKPI